MAITPLPLALAFATQLISVWGYYNSASELLERLFDDYNPVVKPRRNYSQPVELNITVYVDYIEYLDEKDQLLFSSGWTVTSWFDDFLTWNETDYPDVRELYVPFTSVWIPDIYHSNALQSYLSATPGLHNLLVLRHDGLVKRYDVGYLKTRCWIDITYFPFDRQECDIEVSTASSPIWDLYFIDAFMVVDPLAREGFWEILETSWGIDNYTDLDDTYSWSWFTIKVARNPEVYLFFLVVPIVLLSLVTVMPFCLPAESGEKIGLSISVLLSFTIFQSMLVDVMPSGTSDLPYLALHNTAMFIISCLTLIATVLVLYVHNKTTKVPRFLQMLVCAQPNLTESHGQGIHKRKMSTVAVSPAGSAPNMHGAALDEPMGSSEDIANWPLVACLLDRVFFICFTIAILALTSTNVRTYIDYVNEVH